MDRGVPSSTYTFRERNLTILMSILKLWKIVFDTCHISYYARVVFISLQYNTFCYFLQTEI